MVQAILWFSLSNIHQKTTLVDNTTVQREKLLITSIITKIKPKIIKCDKLRYIKDSETKKKHHVQLKVCITNLIPKVGYELKSHDVTYQRYKDINKNGNKHNLNNIYETKKIYALLVNRLFFNSVKKKKKIPNNKSWNELIKSLTSYIKKNQETKKGHTTRTLNNNNNSKKTRIDRENREREEN